MIDTAVLQLIAEHSDGGLRDSLGVLDKLSSYKMDKITIEDYYEINDMITEKELNEFKNSILLLDNKTIIDKIKKYSDSGKNLIEIIKQLLISLRDDIINYYINDNKNNINITEYQKLTNIINKNMFDIKKSGNPRIYIEIMLLNYINNSKIISQEINKSENPIKNEKNDSKIENIVKKEVKKEKIKEDNSDKEKEDSLINNSNLLEINDIRINNVLAKADKKEKIKNLSLIDSLNEYVFDQKIGYIISEILNATLEAASNDALILSYEYESVVDTNLNNLEKLTKVFNEKTDSNKKLAIVSKAKWDKVKKEYINNTKNGKKYDIIEEPDLVIKKSQENKSKNEENALDLFKDIVEIK